MQVDVLKYDDKKEKGRGKKKSFVDMATNSFSLVLSSTFDFDALALST